MNLIDRIVDSRHWDPEAEREGCWVLLGRGSFNLSLWFLLNTSFFSLPNEKYFIFYLRVLLLGGLSELAVKTASSNNVPLMVHRESNGSEGNFPSSFQFSCNRLSDARHPHAILNFPAFNEFPSCSSRPQTQSPCHIFKFSNLLALFLRAVEETLLYPTACIDASVVDNYHSYPFVWLGNCSHLANHWYSVLIPWKLTPVCMSREMKRC